MSSIKNLKVIIVGGSVAGLSLANMLEKLGIDFTLLEAYDTIAPQVGASIGLLGNGLRILDQLGCYEDLCKQAPHSLMSSTLRSKDRILAEHRNLDPLIRGRLGYPFVFMDRQTLLQVLYENLEQKSKVHVATRVVRVELLPGCVKVIAQDGTEWQGDMVVGADGIHSTIRSQMWQLAETLEPGYIPKDEHKKKQSEYACIFGISDPCGKWEGGDTSSIYREGFSYFIVGGPRRRVYWFLFFSLNGVKVGDAIPRFTEQDRERIAREHWDDIIDDNVKFGDLYAVRRVAVLTSLEEVVFSKWHFKRIMTIGDAAHKLHPLGAQGGNSAIETAAALANGLAFLAKQKTELSEHVLDLMFKQVTDKRRDRVTRLMKKAHLRQSIEALDGFFPSFIALQIIPRLQSPRIFDRLYADTCGARKLDMLPTPVRSKQAPFHDEMLRVPRRTTKMLILVSVALLLLAAVASFFLHQNVVVLFHVPGSFMKGQIHNFYCSTILFSFQVFWLAENASGRAQGISYVILTVCLLLCERYGFSVAAPLLFIPTLISNSRVTGMLPFGQGLPASDEAALVTAFLCYGVPSILQQLKVTRHFLEGSPVLILNARPISTGAIAYCLSKSSRLTGLGSSNSKNRYSNTRYKKLYMTTAVAATTAHMITIWSWVSSRKSSSNIGYPVAPLGVPLVDRSSNGLDWAQWDIAIFALEGSVWLIARTWSLIQTGLLDMNFMYALLLLSLSLILGGPGAAMSLVWYWQDTSLIELLTKI